MSSLLETLFSSKTRANLLVLLLTSPHRAFYQRELERILHVPIRAIQQEVSKLINLGLLETEASGNRVYLRVNTHFSLYTELKNLILKSEAFQFSMKEELEHLKSVPVCFIFGSFVEGIEKEGSDIDLMLIGEASARELGVVTQKMSEKLGREINSHLYSLDEFKKKFKGNNNFIKQVALAKKIYLIGDEDELKKIIG